VQAGSVQIATACLEALDALEAEGDFSDEDREKIELAVLEGARMMREELTTALSRARNLPLEGYPLIADVAAAR
jgi:molecular chaperone GrpE (heat shock protein)